MPKTKRKPPIEEALLSAFEIPDVSPLWRAYEPALEAMFQEPTENSEIGLSERAVCLFRYGDPTGDWSWYVNTRKEPQYETKPYFAEEQIYKKLFEAGPNTLLYLFGHIGVGKSTIIHYFFRNYLPKVKKWPQARLEKIVPVKIALRFDNVDKLEDEWDTSVTDFLYDHFEELTTRNFLENLARYICYPTYFRLRMNDAGELMPTSLLDKRTQFIQDTEDRIHTTLNKIDRTSVIAWIRNDICREVGASIGWCFNSKVIPLLAEYYGYEFVFIVDNVDQLSKAIQRKICGIVDRKIDSYKQKKNIRFIIATRENFLEPIYRETFPISYMEHQHMVRLPPLPFRSVLQRRKTAFFDSNKSKCSGIIKLSGESLVKLSQPDVYVDSVFAQFDNLSHLTNLHKIANQNTRTMLDLVKELLRSPHVTLEDIGKVIDHSRNTGNTEPDLGEFVSIHRMIDILVRGSNYLVAIQSRAPLPNLYYSGNKEHFSSTLTRLFVIMIVNMEDSIKYTDLEGILGCLGHDTRDIEKAVNNLLSMQVLFSNRGFSIEEDTELKMKQKLEKRDLPYSEFLTEEIVPSLRYLQAMAFVTPMSKEYCKYVRIPHKVGTPVATFKLRLTGAGALYQQIRDDMIEQMKYIKGSDQKQRAERVFKLYGFSSIIDDIHAEVNSAIKDIGLENPELVSGIDVTRLFPKLNS